MQKFFYKRSPVWDYILMLVGTALIAVSIQCVYDPVSMVTGGFTGLAIIIKDVTGYLIPGGIPLWLTNLVLNVPLFLAALKIKGKRFIWRTIVGTLLLSLWLYILPLVDLTDGDYVLAAIFGGCIGGVGMGLVLLAKSTTGGTEMVATRKCKVWRIGKRQFGIILTQGLNRQIRRMCEYFGYRVEKLVRTRIMNIELGDLKAGTYREVTPQEYKELMRLVKDSSNTTVIHGRDGGDR